MSIIRQLLVTSIVEALRDNTLAGGCVFDSRIDALEKDGKGHSAIIVSAEDSKAVALGQASRGFFGRNAELTILVQTCVYAGYKGQASDDGGSYIVETDAACEAVLNLLDRGWKTVLSQPQASNAWAGIFRDLVIDIGDLNEARAVDPETGSKHAARFVSFKATVIAEPTLGEELAPVIAKGLDALEADGDPAYKAWALDWRSTLSAGGDLPDWRKMQSALFMTDGATEALGLNEPDPEPAESDDDP